MLQPRVSLVSALGVSSIAASEYELPLGVLTLASILRESCPVTIVDLDDLWLRAAGIHDLFETRAIDAIVASRPDILGLSSVSGSYPLTIRLANVSREVLPNTTIVLGGPQATVTDVATLKAFSAVDMILRGEADETLPRLVVALGSASSITRIPGLTYRAKGQVHRNPNASPVADLDKIPLPAFDLVPRLNELNSLPLEAGRGCPYACTFCSTNDFFRRQFRLKSSAHLLDEMRRLKALRPSRPVTAFRLTHDMFTVDRRRLVDFCKTMIAANEGFEWSCSARTDSLDPETIGLMHEAGCRAMFFGIETGSARMQRIVGKNLDLDEARVVLRRSSDLGIHCDASLIIGYPEETEEDLRDSVRFFADAMMLTWVDPQLNVLSPLAETPMTSRYRSELVLDEKWAEISECGTMQTPADKLLIASHPDLFTCFYGMPYRTGRESLRRLHHFLFYGRTRCGGLLRSVYVHCKDMLKVFEEWEKSAFRTRSGDFHELSFAFGLIDFCETQYATVPRIVAVARFYRSALQRAHEPEASREIAPPFLQLADGVVMVEAECDILRILESLGRGTEPEEDAFSSTSAVVVSGADFDRSYVQRFNETATELLRQANRRTSLGEIQTRFQALNISIPGFSASELVEGGIEYLEQQKLVRRIFPA